MSYTVPKLLDSDKWKLIYTVFYDNSLDVATFTSQRLEGKIDLRQQIGNSGEEPGTRPGPSSITYRFDFRRVKATNFAKDFSAGEIALLSLPARVGGPGFTYIRDKRDNPLESTKGNYFTLDAFALFQLFRIASGFRQGLWHMNSTYHAFGGKGKPGRQYVFARSTTIGLEQPAREPGCCPPGACPNLNTTLECTDIVTIPLPRRVFAGGGVTRDRGFGLTNRRPARSVFRVSGRRHGAVRQQFRTAPAPADTALFRGGIRVCDFSRYGQRLYRAA